MKFQKAFPLITHLSERLATILFCFFLVTAFLPTGSSITPGYRDRATLLQDFFNLMSQYPTLMTYESIGKSYQGRDIPMFMIGNPNGGKVLFTVATHGDEIQGGELGYYMAEWLLERREPEIADRILQNNLILIVIGNIDSYGITRKNMDLYGFVQGAYANSYGVDLNRNMPVGWGGRDSSNNVTDMHYQGPSPGSEPESQALIHVFQEYKPQFHLNYHYGGGMVFAKPSGYAKMSASMSQYHDVIANKIRTLAASRGVRVFGYGQLGISGCVTDQAYVSGNSTSYLLEAGNWPAPLYDQIESVLMPQLLPFLIVFAQESEVVGTLFADGLESGDFSAWTGTYVTPGETATVVRTLPYQGNYNAKFSSNGTSGFEGAYSYESVPTSSRLYASGYFYVSQSGTAENDDRFYLIRFLAGGNSVAYAGWRRTGGVDKWDLIIRDATGWSIVYSDSIPSLNRWYSLELYWVEDATNGYGELYVDGALTCSIQNQNTTAFGGIDQVRFGLAELYNCNNTTVYCDSVRIDNSKAPQSQIKIGDLNGDGSVDICDVLLAAAAYGSTPIDPNWNAAADLNHDNRVDICDLIILAAQL